MKSRRISLPIIELGEYEHYKGKRYEVVGICLHTETLEPMVLYRPLYKSEVAYWSRPYAMFIDSAEVDGKYVPRFRNLGVK